MVEHNGVKCIRFHQRFFIRWEWIDCCEKKERGKEREGISNSSKTLTIMKCLSGKEEKKRKEKEKRKGKGKNSK